MNLLEPAGRLEGKVDIGVEEQVDIMQLAWPKRELGKLQDDRPFLLLFDEAFDNPARLVLRGAHPLGADPSG